MFTIECLDFRDDIINPIFICDRDSLYTLTDMINNNEYIKEFKVSIGTTIFMPKDLGWNNNAKWVSQFTYD